MVKGIYGVTIAVKDLAQAVPRYEAFLGIKATHAMELEAENTMARLVYHRDELLDIGFDSRAETAYFKLSGGARITLIASSDENSVVGKFIAAKGEGLLMVSLNVDDAKRESERIKGQGIGLVLDKNATGSFGESNFVHPKTLSGVQFEIFEPSGDYRA